MEEQSINNLFKNRLKESNIFNDEEIKLIEANIMLYEKSYHLGWIDKG